MNNSVKIILAVVTFVACAALGYLVGPSNNPKSNTTQIDGNGTGGDNNTPSDTPEPVPPPKPEPVKKTIPEITSTEVGEPDSNGVRSLTVIATVESGDNLMHELYEIGKTTAKYTSYSGWFEEVYPVDGGKYLLKVVNTKTREFAECEIAGFDKVDKPVQSVETTPEIKSVSVGQRDSKNYKKIGLAFIAKAVVASGDKLRYELYEIGETTAKYTSDNGSFKEVYPVDGGKYLLKVVNAKTGDFAERQVSGFNKIDKYTSAKLQDVLNGEYDKHFYFHFDTEKLRFDCEGIDSSIVPTSLNALLSDRSGHGWTYVVVGTPLYDKYNRITYFKVRITE